MADKESSSAPRRSIRRVAPGTFLVQTGDRRDIIFAVGPSSNRWAFWNGQVFTRLNEPSDAAFAGGATTSSSSYTLTAPMPATVVQVLVAPGARVTAGETVVLLEAMKMELPIRALANGRVKAIHCQAGDLVRANQELVHIEQGPI
jgi:3-methylcrotonyl-CoA carboxylase alpha subunit